MEKITVIIPAHNEEVNIYNTIQIAKKSKLADEILVVNNLSEDRTVEISRECGVRVEDCNNQGKGFAMEDGVRLAKNDLMVFLDADVKYSNEDVVDILARPVLDGEVDMTKSSFDRVTGGVVTEVAVKPLLKLVFPDMYEFCEPISGMIAVRRSLIKDFEFEKDYGVDIGILIDAIKAKHRVKEINIGKIENFSHARKTNASMARMSTEVMRAILKRSM